MFEVGMGDFDPSQITEPITDVFRTIYSHEPGMYTQQNPDGSYTTYRQPIGNVSNLPVGSVSGQFGTTVQGAVDSGSGVWILLGIGALVFFLSRRK